MRWVFAVLVWAGCYHPAGEASCAVRCGAGGACPGGLSCDTASGLCAIGGRCGDAGAPGADASIGDGSGSTVCFATHMLGTFCFGGVAGMFAPTAIDTDMPCNAVVSRPGRPGDLCVLAADTISISGVVHATGTRGLVLLAHQLDISGELDAIAQSMTIAPGAGHCTAPVGMPVAGESGTGGAGGSMQVKGGDGGGNGAAGVATSADGAVPDTVFLAGCAGGAGGKGFNGVAPGAGGAAGGAVYLFGDTIDIVGAVTAYGLGGKGGDGTSGGGGGGSGGMIVLDGALTLQPGAVLLATGGGGGAGGNSIGVPGQDGFAPMVSDPSASGDGGTAGSGGGDGGDGATDGTKTGVAGLPGSGGAGGGGGGGGAAGWILMYPTLVQTAQIYPPPVLAP